jgi:hypothetical protein
MCSYPPGMGISYPHTVRARISLLRLSPLPERISTSHANLSPCHTPLSPWWISYPQGLGCLYRLTEIGFATAILCFLKAYPLIHRAYYYYGNILFL